MAGGRIGTAAIAAGVIALLLAPPGRGDVVTLKSGPKVFGKVVSADDAAVVEIETADGPKRFRRSMVERVDRTGPEGRPATLPDPWDVPGPASRPDLSAVASAGPATKPDLPAVGEAPPAGPATKPDSPAAAHPAAPAEPPKTYAEALARATKVATAADGAALWDAFIKALPPGPQVDLAKAQLATWNQRLADKLVRFGPDWVAADKVQARLKEADDLVARAAASRDAEAALKLLDDASKANPYRDDIPFRKGVIYLRMVQSPRFGPGMDPRSLADVEGYKRLVAAEDRWREAKTAQFGSAMGEVVKLNDGHPAARNNLGVLCAREHKWDAAFAQFGKIAAGADTDTMLDNLDLVIALARKSGAQGVGVGAAERAIQQKVARIHAAGAHVGENRLGNGWVAEGVYQKWAKVAAALDTRMVDLRVKLRDAGPHNAGLTNADSVLRQQAAFQAEIDALQAEKDNLAPHAERLTMLDADGVTPLPGNPQGPAAKQPGPAE